MSVKLRTKLTFAYLVPVLAVFVGAGALAYRAASRGLEEELGRRLSDVAQTIAGHLMATRDGGRLARLDLDPESAVRSRLNEWLEALRRSTEVRRIFVFRPDGEGGNQVSLLDTDDSVEVGDVLFELEPDRIELARLFDGEAPRAHSILFTDEDGSRYMNGYAVVRWEDELAAVVGVAGSAQYFSALDTYRTALGVMGLLVIGLVVLVSLVVSYRLTQPIGTLVNAVRRFGRGELKEPVEVRSRDEIGFLAEAFDDMRVSLDRRDEQMQLMLSGIAHEVRNPLAGMELFCSLLADELEQRPDQRELVERISRELDYLSRVVQAFLSYARRRPLSSERFAAETMLKEVADGVSGLAADRGVRVVVDVALGVELTAEREAVRGMLANLVRNGVQACSADGEVTVRVVAEADERVISVEDTGKGIPPDQLEKIFEPFFTTKEQGTGLGLALVHKCVREHGGDIEVDSVLGRGTRFEIRLPFDASLKPLVHIPDYEGGDDGLEMIG